jgi:hypothetical protein
VSISGGRWAECRSRRFQGGVDLCGAVGGGDEAGLEGRRRQEHAALEHGVEEAPERGSVAGDRTGIGVDRRIAEEQPEHAADAGGVQRHPGLARGRLESVAQGMCGALERVVETRRLHQLQHRQPGGHRHRIAAQGAGLVDRAGRRDLFHQVAAPAVGAHRHAAADDLAEGGQVGGDPVARLRAAERDPEAGHHFVEDQQRAVPGAQRAQVLQVALARRQAVGVADHRFDDQRGDVVAGLVEQRGGRVEVVVGQGQRQVRQRLGHARRGGHAEGQRAAAGLDQERVAVAVVAALELDDARAPGGAARQPDRRQRGLGAGVDHPYHLAAGHQPGDGLGHLHFQRIGRAE